MSTLYIVALIVSVASSRISSGAQFSYLKEETALLGKSPRWDGTEHVAAGNLGTLRLLVGPSGEEDVEGITVNPNNNVLWVDVPVEKYVFRSYENLTLGTYGDIVGMGGDFYGPQSDMNVLCSGGNNTDKNQDTVWAVFREMWLEAGKQGQDRLSRIKNNFAAELSNVTKVLSGNTTGPTLTQQLFYAFQSAAAKVPADTNSFRMANIASWNLDHFGGCARDAYTRFHSAATRYALDSGLEFRQFNIPGESDPSVRREHLLYSRRKLLVAFALEAFGAHYLSDLFSSGHMRVPRQELRRMCSQRTDNPNSLADSTLLYLAPAGILAKYMHDEDCVNGLVVSNIKGETWKAYGDWMFFAPQNSDNRAHVRRALQLARDEIAEAFVNGSLTGMVWKEIPFLNDSTVANTCPLYRRSNNLKSDIQRRQELFAHDTACSFVDIDYKACPNMFKTARDIGVLNPKSTGWVTAIAHAFHSWAFSSKTVVQPLTSIMTYHQNLGTWETNEDMFDNTLGVPSDKWQSATIALIVVCAVLVVLAVSLAISLWISVTGEVTQPHPA